MTGGMGERPEDALRHLLRRAAPLHLVSWPVAPGLRSKDSPAATPRHTRPGDASDFPPTRTKPFPLENDPAHALHLHDLKAGLQRLAGPVLMLSGEDFPCHVVPKTRRGTT
jgi:hypothetical protein